MSDNVVNFTGRTTLPIPPEKILQEATKINFSHVLVIGFKDDGSEFVSSSDPDGGMVLWMMERAKHRLMRIADELSE